MGLFLRFEESLTPREGPAKSAKTAFALGGEGAREEGMVFCWTGEQLLDEALGTRKADPQRGA
jgi:hypothetical protein